VPVDTRATINDDVLNNIGTIEVVILRCQDDPKNMPVNPFDFPKLPVLTKSTPAVSNNNIKQHRKAAYTDAKAKKNSDQGGDDDALIGGMMGMFDGAADYPASLDGHQDSREPRAYHFDDRSRQHNGRSHRHESSRRPYSGRQRYLEEDLLVASSTDEELQKTVHFNSPVATYSRGRTSNRYRSPSSSRYTRHDREEIHPFLLRSRRHSPERDTSLDSQKRQYPDARDLHVDKDRRRRSSPEELVHYLVDGYEKRRSGDFIRERNRSRSSIRGRDRNGSSDKGERRRNGNLDKREKDIDPREAEIYATAARFLQGVKQGPSKESKGRRECTPSPSSTSVRCLLLGIVTLLII
jgi:hypothetical protein